MKIARPGMLGPMRARDSASAEPARRLLRVTLAEELDVQPGVCRNWRGGHRGDRRAWWQWHENRPHAQS
eukprot:4655081-Pyramimonas_sp.AAC.1